MCGQTAHCCWIGGALCRYLRDDGPRSQRRYVCTLRERLGSWAAVHADLGYRFFVRPTLAALPAGVDCGDWPQPPEVCQECGLNG